MNPWFDNLLFRKKHLDLPLAACGEESAQTLILPMQNQRTEDPLRNACLLAGGLLAFSSIGGIVMPPLLGLPMTLVYCACIQLGIGFMLLACGWFRWTTKAMWRCLLISAVLWLANTGVFLLTFFRVLQ